MDALLTTREVAELLKVGEEWVREHAAELGGIRMGRTNRAPLRFEPEIIEAWKRRQTLETPDPPAPPRQRPGRRPTPAGVELFRPRTRGTA